MTLETKDRAIVAMLAAFTVFNLTLELHPRIGPLDLKLLHIGRVGMMYAVYLTALLVHRVRRDDRRCREKYGAAWAAYCAAVPYRMVPRVW